MLLRNRLLNLLQTEVFTVVAKYFFFVGSLKRNFHVINSYLVPSLFLCRIVSLTTLTQGRIYIISQLISNRVSFLLNLIMKDLTCKWNVNCNVPKFQARIHTVFHRFTEIGQIFHNNFLIKKKLCKLHGFIQGEWNWPMSCLNDSETQEKGL